MNCAGCSAVTANRSSTRESRIADADLAGQPVCAVRLRCRDRLRRLDAVPAVRTGLNLGLQRFGRCVRSEDRRTREKHRGVAWIGRHGRLPASIALGVGEITDCTMSDGVNEQVLRLTRAGPAAYARRRGRPLPVRNHWTRRRVISAPHVREVRRSSHEAELLGGRGHCGLSRVSESAIWYRFA